MRAYLSVKFDRPVDKDKHYISPGGYEVKTSGGETINFDFEHGFGAVRMDDPTIMDFEFRDADTFTFPAMEKLLQVLPEVTQMTECYIYTGEQDEPEINVAKILEFSIEGSDPEIMNKPTDTDYVVSEIMGRVEGEPPIVLYTFTQKLLENVQPGHSNANEEKDEIGNEERE